MNFVTEYYFEQRRLDIDFLPRETHESDQALPALIVHKSIQLVRNF